MKRLLLFILSVILVLPGLFSCADNSNTQSSSLTPPTDSSVVTSSSDSGKTDTDTPLVDPAFDSLSSEDKAFYLLNYDVNDEGRQTAHLNMDLNTTYYGIKFNMNVYGSVTEIISNDGLIYLMEQTAVVSSPDSTSTTVMKEGFIDGKAFEYYEFGSNVEKYYKNMSVDDYMKKLENEDDEGFFINKDECGKASCFQDSKGSWIASFSNITGESLESFRSYLPNMYGISPSKLSDVTVTISMNKNFLPLNISMIFHFTSATTFNISADYVVGSAVRVPDIDISDYEKTDTLPGEDEDNSSENSGSGGILM